MKLKSSKLFTDMALLISQCLTREHTQLRASTGRGGLAVWMDFPVSSPPRRKGQQKTREWGPPVSAQQHILNILKEGYQIKYRKPEFNGVSWIFICSICQPVSKSPPVTSPSDNYSQWLASSRVKTPERRRNWHSHCNSWRRLTVQHWDTHSWMDSSLFCFNLIWILLKPHVLLLGNNLVQKEMFHSLLLCFLVSHIYYKSLKHPRLELNIKYSEHKFSVPSLIIKIVTIMWLIVHVQTYSAL